MRAVDYSQYGATTLAAESPRAQLHSQCKLTTPRHENQKIRHENELLKAKEPTPVLSLTDVFYKLKGKVPFDLNQ
jgi:hypothetical protein